MKGIPNSNRIICRVVIYRISLQGANPSSEPHSFTNMISSAGFVHPQHAPGSTQNPFAIGAGGIIDSEKRKRNRTFIDPVSEVPRLEEWFQLNTHPSHALIARYTEELNHLPYRQKVSIL